jgi:hypothetical protein
MQSDQETLEVRFRRSHTVLLYLGSVALAALGYWLRVVEAGDPASGQTAFLRQTYDWAFPWFPWVCMIFFGFCALKFGRAVFDRRPQLVIGRHGILWRKWSATEIPWSEVTDIDFKRIVLSDFICILVRDRKRVPGSGLEKFVAPINRLMQNGDISIPLTGLDTPKDTIMAAVDRNIPGQR